MLLISLVFCMTTQANAPLFQSYNWQSQLIRLLIVFLHSASVVYMSYIFLWSQTQWYALNPLKRGLCNIMQPKQSKRLSKIEVRRSEFSGNECEGVKVRVDGNALSISDGILRNLDLTKTNWECYIYTPNTQIYTGSGKQCNYRPVSLKEAINKCFNASSFASSAPRTKFFCHKTAS